MLFRLAWVAEQDACLAGLESTPEYRRKQFFEGRHEHHGNRLRCTAQQGRRPGCRVPRGFAGTTVRRGATALIDVEDVDTAEGVDLPGADLSHEELVVKIVPPQPDEFTCMSCFLVRHRSQIAREKNGEKFCRDCEG